MAVDSPYKTLWFLRSLSDDVLSYLIEQQQDGGVWTEIATTYAVSDQWAYQTITDTLDDLSIYSFRITSLDVYGNACAVPLVIGPEKVVRTPNAPLFDVTFNTPATTVTFSD